jgi:nicotinate dehydrogenase subunit A
VADASVAPVASIRVLVNGTEHRLAAAGSARLLDVLRDDLGLTGTRLGCGQGECGACHVLVDGQSLPACDTPLWAVEGRDVTTVEALPAALREAFMAEQAAQCGYCSAGMLASAAALLRRVPQPSRDEIHSALDRHLCRCGAHPRIVRAVLRAARALTAPVDQPEGQPDGQAVGPRAGPATPAEGHP